MDLLSPGHQDQPRQQDLSGRHCIALVLISLSRCFKYGPELNDLTVLVNRYVAKL